MVKGLTSTSQTLNGASLKVLIVYTRWNAKVVNALVEGAMKTLMLAGVKKEMITLRDVPGSYELPFATQSLLKQEKLTANPFDVAISIGINNIVT